MGARNALLAYTKYASRVPPLPMQCLVYMAIISKDSDEAPWYGQGHAALAQHALGRQTPIGRGDVRAVERAIAPPLDVGAITTDRRAAPRGSGPRTVRYRLNLRLSPPAEDVHRNPVDERPPDSDQDVHRNPSNRPPENGRASHGNRWTEENEEPGGATRGIDGEGNHQRAGDAHAREAENDDQSTRLAEEAEYRAAIKVMHKLTAGQVAAVKAAAKNEIGPGATNKQIVIRAAELDGRRYQWRRGDLVTLDVAEIGPLARDGGDVCAWGEPLDDAQAAAVLDEMGRRTEAEAAEARQREQAIADHIRGWPGRWCSGRPGERPHEAYELDAARTGDGWTVACPPHLAVRTAQHGECRS